MIDAIEAILFEPVGTFADFRDGSQRYWERVSELESRGYPFGTDEPASLESSEIEAVDQAVLYDDAAPALSELSALGITLIAASSLSEVALARFLDRASLTHFFRARWSRDTSGGVGALVLTKAVTAGDLDPSRVLFLTDTEAGVRAAQKAGVHPILMMNDPDEAMRLTSCHPAGGIVSLHELPDFVRLVTAQSTMKASER